jgi:DNA-binding transcriptional LysR family regulator
VLRQLDELSVSFSKASLAGVVRLGASSICLDLLSAMSIATSRNMPLVSYQVEIERAAPLLDRIESRKLDLAIVSGPIEAHKFRSRSLGYDRMLWVMSPRVQGERRHLPMAERLKGAPVWCVHPDSFYWGPATTGLRAQGADLERVNAVGNTMAVARVVAGGAGIGLVSEFLVRDEMDAGRLLPVPDLPRCETIEFSIVAAADNSSTIVDEVMAAAVAASPFARTPPEG